MTHVMTNKIKTGSELIENGMRKNTNPNRSNEIKMVGFGPKNQQGSADSAPAHCRNPENEIDDTDQDPSTSSFPLKTVLNSIESGVRHV